MGTEDALREHLAKRDLDVSGEPGGGEPAARPRFVIQRHDASSLHFDLLVTVDDAGADRPRNPVATQPESVLSGRTNQDLEVE